MKKSRFLETQRRSVGIKTSLVIGIFLRIMGKGTIDRVMWFIEE